MDLDIDMYICMCWNSTEELFMDSKTDRNVYFVALSMRLPYHMKIQYYHKLVLLVDVPTMT